MAKLTLFTYQEINRVFFFNIHSIILNGEIIINAILNMKGGMLNL